MHCARTRRFNADALLQVLDERDAIAEIPPNTNRKIQRDYDAEVYKWRHLAFELLRKDERFQRDSHKVRKDRL